MDVADILKHVISVYATCRSYRDEGESVTTFDPGTSRKRTEWKPFRTLFVRPDLFLFEFQKRRGSDDRDRYVVWRRNDRVRTWWSAMPHWPERDTLSLALAGATGISGSSAHSAPRLLLPDEVSGRMTIDSSGTLVVDGDAEKENCLVLEQAAGPRVERLWIDKNSFLIRKIVTPPYELESRIPERDLSELRRMIEERGGDWPSYEAQLRARQRDKFQVESVTTYSPQIDVDIDPAEFDFQPPTDLR